MASDLPVIDRYITPEMNDLWSYERKYHEWLRVELAYLTARAAHGDLDLPAPGLIMEHARYTVDGIHRTDKILHHDMNAFIAEVRSSLVGTPAEKYAGEFHKGLTSYSVEDPAEILRLREAVKRIINEGEKLIDPLEQRARQYQYTLCMAYTHGQSAKPTTFGHQLLVYRNAVTRCLNRLDNCLKNELSEANISGAVGNFIGMNPEVCKSTATALDLKLASAETQILQRDRHAEVLNCLAILATTLENIAESLWIRMRSDSGSIQEPFSAKQMGSSAMPHKRNPIITEQVKGIAALVRADAMVGFVCIVPREFRTIEQSSQERHTHARATTLTHYLLRKMTWLMSGLIVDEELLAAEVSDTGGIWASQEVKEALVGAGTDPEVAYRYIQRITDRKKLRKKPFRDLLYSENIDETGATGATVLGEEKLQQLFNVIAAVTPGIEYIFGRFDSGKP